MNRLFNSLNDRRVLVLVAHYDDEALFCGGTLLAARDTMQQLTIAVVTAVHYTNASPPGTSTELEAARRRCRLRAFTTVCERLRARPVHLGCRNLHSHGTDSQQVKDEIEAEVEPVLAEVLRHYGTDVVLTHGASGEYGSPQHQLVHRLAARRFSGQALWCFSGDRGDHVPVDWPAKRDLLDVYKQGGTPSGRWDPECFPEYRTWCGDVEYFTRHS